MKPKSGILSLPDEIIHHILSLLPWRDILRCTSLCKALRRTYMSSFELQYITELGGQQLLPVFDGHISLSKRLQLLRDKAHAWFKFNIHSFEVIFIPVQFRTETQVSIVNGHVCFWNPDIDSSKIFPIPRKPLQQTIERDFSPDSLCSVPKQIQSNFDVLNVHIDPVQNLLAILYVRDIVNGGLVSDEKYYIDLVALDGNEAHPQAAGRTLIFSDFPNRSIYVKKNVKIEGFGRHIACLLFDDDQPLFAGASRISRWRLQVWDWQHSTESKCILSGPIIDPDTDQIDMRFLGNDRLLIISNELKLYSIEDMSQEPRLLACFLLPVLSMNLRCFTQTDDIAHAQKQALQVTWISDPEHRLLALETRSSDLYFVISTRIFFEPDFVDSEGPAATIPWRSWGPSNTRVFPHEFSCRLGVSGSRAVHAFAADDTEVNDRGDSIATEYRLHLMDFSPSAIKRHHQQGLGRIVNEPSTVENITTSMPYVEVVSDRTFSNGEFIETWLDRDKLYLLKDNPELDETDRFEVIEF